MAVSCAVWQIVDETVEDIKNDPSAGKEILSEMGEYNDELPEDRKILLNLEKAWDGLNHLFARKYKSELASFLTTGGTALSGLDFGYGEGRVFSPAETAELSKLLQAHSFEKLCEGVTVKELIEQEVYPFQGDETEKQAFGSLAPYWSRLKTFVAAAVECRRGILVLFS